MQPLHVSLFLSNFLLLWFWNFSDAHIAFKNKMTVGAGRLTPPRIFHFALPLPLFEFFSNN